MGGWEASTVLSVSNSRTDPDALRAPRVEQALNSMARERSRVVPSLNVSSDQNLRGGGVVFRREIHGAGFF
jgi:hypothetical protein